MRIKMSFLTRITNLNSAYYVFILAFLYRLPNLASFINDDDSLWKYRGYVFGEAMFSLDFGRTAVTYHPGVPLMWSQMFAIKTFGVLDDLIFKGQLIGSQLFFYNHLIQNLYLLIFTSFLITFVFILIRRVIGEKSAILFMLILLLEPFFIALGRSLHNDLLVSLFVYLGFLGLFNFYSGDYKYEGFLKTGQSKIIILTGLFSALALLTKSASLFLLPLFLSLLFLFVLIKKSDIAKYLSGLTWVIIYSLIFFVLVWPAMWVNPSHTLWLYFYKGIFDTAIEEGHRHLWFGVETMNPGFWFYPVVLVGRYTILVVVGTILGIILASYRIIKTKLNFSELDRNTRFALINIIFFVGFFAMLSLTAKKLDRYTIPMFFPMAVLTVYAIGSFQKRFGKLVLIFVTIILLSRLILLAWIHPNYFVYYSPLIGGMDKGRQIIEPKWVIGFNDVAAFLNEINRNSESRIHVVSPDSHILSYFADFDTIYPDNIEAPRKGQYFVVPTWKAEGQRMISLFSLTDDMLIKTIKIAGVEYYDIYKK